MKNKFNNSQVSIAKFMMDNLNGTKYEVSFTSCGNLMFKNYFDDNEHFVISYFNNKWWIRRYAYHLDRCYRICPSKYERHDHWSGPYTVRYYGWSNFNDALMAFVKFIEKNR